MNFSFNASTNAFSPTNNWVRYTSDVFTVTTAETYELKIAADNPAGGYSGSSAVANVNLSAVPEPASVAMTMGAAGLFLLRRRRIS